MAGSAPDWHSAARSTAVTLLPACCRSWMLASHVHAVLADGGLALLDAMPFTNTVRIDCSPDEGILPLVKALQLGRLGGGPLDGHGGPQFPLQPSAAVPAASAGSTPSGDAVVGAARATSPKASRATKAATTATSGRRKAAAGVVGQAEADSQAGGPIKLYVCVPTERFDEVCKAASRRGGIVQSTMQYRYSIHGTPHSEADDSIQARIKPYIVCVDVELDADSGVDAVNCVQSL